MAYYETSLLFSKNGDPQDYSIANQQPLMIGRYDTLKEAQDALILPICDYLQDVQGRHDGYYDDFGLVPITDKYVNTLHKDKQAKELGLKQWLVKLNIDKDYWNEANESFKPAMGCLLGAKITLRDPAAEFAFAEEYLDDED